MCIVMIATGMIEYTLELVNALAEHHRVTFFVPRKLFAHLEWAVQPSVDLRMFEWPRHRNPRNLIFMMELERLLKELRPDVIHFQGGQLWLNVLMPLLDQFTFITTVHDVVPHVGDTPSQKIPLWVGDYTPRHSHRVITHGHKLRVALAHRLHFPLDRIDVIPHGVLSFYRHLLSSPNGSTPQSRGDEDVLFFGRIYAYKGLHYLIEAQPAITRAIPNARIVIAGKGEDFQKYEAMMPERDKFKVYNDYISTERVAELFHRAKVVALPYIDGSQSGVLQLAYAFHKPVVATRVGSIDEAVDDGRTGLLVPPGDADALAGAIVELLQDQEKREQMSRSIAAEAATRFSWRHIAAATVRTYQRAVADHSILPSQSNGSGKRFQDHV